MYHTCHNQRFVLRSLAGQWVGKWSMWGESSWPTSNPHAFAQKSYSACLLPLCSAALVRQMEVFLSARTGSLTLPVANSYAATLQDHCLAENLASVLLKHPADLCMKPKRRATTGKDKNKTQLWIVAQMDTCNSVHSHVRMHSDRLERSVHLHLTGMLQ